VAAAATTTAAAAPELAAVARAGVPPRTTDVPEGWTARSQLTSLDDLLPQRLEPKGLPLEWSPEQQTVTGAQEEQEEQHKRQQQDVDAGARCEDTAVGADGRTQHLLLRGLR
jgi:hypothetical protein